MSEKKAGENKTPAKVEAIDKPKTGTEVKVAGGKGSGKAVTLAEAKKLIKEANQIRANQCLQEVEAVCKKYSCTLVGIPFIIRDGRISAEVTVRALDQPEAPGDPGD